MRALLIAVGLSLPAHAGDFQRAAAGSSSAKFLKLGAGARAMAMGEAYSALGEEPTAAYWNPAGLSHMAQPAVSFSRSEHVAGISLNHLYAAKPWGGGWVTALGAGYMSYGSVAQTDQSGVQTGSLSPSDLVVSASVANTVGAGMAAGATVKYVSSKLLDRAQTYAADLGLLSPWLWQEQMRLALTALNIGPGLRYGAEREPLPFRLRAGLAFRVSRNWTCTWDVEAPRDNAPVNAVGTEYRMGSSAASFAWRLGYNTRAATDVAGPTGLSLGLGLALRRMDFDYALASLGSLGAAHRFTVGLRFGQARAHAD